LAGVLLVCGCCREQQNQQQSPITGTGAAGTATAPTTPVATFTSPKGQRFAISRLPDTNPPERLEPLALAPGGAPSGDAFRGHDRKAAKLSIANASVEQLDDLAQVLDSLPSDAAMTSHNPPITEDADSGRVTEEKRNVRVRAWLYAAKKEADNDFHLIMGREPGKPPRYMTMELTGLPPSGAPGRDRLKAVRDGFKTFFGQDLPGSSYDKYDPPIPVEVTGSLFFDVDHPAGAVGPQGLKPKTAWEVHPVTELVFEP
jgi:hypothetical protein